jgi:ribose transport system ATP-binding protein
MNAQTAERAADDVLVIRGLRKTFGSSVVLDDIDLSVRRGEIHALVGQNGSGKSTLIKVLSGVHTADAGTLTMDGRPLSAPVRVSELRRHGLAVVHQDLGLVPGLTVLENVRVGHYTRSRLSRRIRWDIERAAAERTLSWLDADFGLDQRVSALHAGQRAVVAIARALQAQRDGSGLIVFDESTQSLPREVLQGFHATVRRIARTGTAILLVSHRLDEVLGLADRVSVLRDGRLALAGQPSRDLTEASLSHVVLGRELDQAAPWQQSPHAAASGPALLEARGLRGSLLRGLDVALRPGEVVGVTGRTESGYEESPYALAGVTAARGELTVRGQAVSLPCRDRSQLTASGVVLVPQHRLAEGLAAQLSALENLTLPRVARRGRPFLRRGWQLREFATAVASMRITPPDASASVSAFSGGNQQKILLAKWLLGSPSVLLLHEPTQAVDVGARLEILTAIRRTADQGAAVLISSIEAQDLAFVCDRVLVLADGVAVRELTGPCSAEDISTAVYGAPGVPDASSASNPPSAASAQIN